MIRGRANCEEWGEERKRWCKRKRREKCGEDREDERSGRKEGEMGDNGGTGEGLEIEKKM